MSAMQPVDAAALAGLAILRTASALGLKIPRAVLQHADEVIR